MLLGKARCSALAGAVVGLASLASGCGGSTSPSVASLGTTSSKAGGAATSPGFPSSGGPVGASMSIQVGTGAAGVAYTACMRAHGVPSYPDPDAQGTITITVSASLDPSSPVFQRAQARCGHLIPSSKPPSPALLQRMREHALAFAACMRAHGVSKYPDPTFSNGGVSQSLDARTIQPSSPVFRAAQKACQP